MTPPSHRMRRFSAPPPTVGERVLGFLFLAVPVGLFAWFLSMADHAARWIIGGPMLLYLFFCVYRWRCNARVRAQRAGESICTFARAIDARRRDTWVVRAVHEEIGSFASYPIRPTDRLYELGYLDDELDIAAFKIARRAGRSMENTPQNPLFERVVTVADLVAFMEHQPRIVAV